MGADHLTKLDRIETAIRNAGVAWRLCFAPHRGGYKFALTSEKLTGSEYAQIASRFADCPAAPPPVDAVVDTRRNNLRARSLG